ncbi:MFS transporter [Streptomyces sp. t39]|uniref:MFS transporter n=1 Tax=Streptomyces sp. t39 TaxID=1828156 RepID=UPI0011CD677F|nr:MFS transporter [Streptomyces sp. t39]TXS47730.1 MFS transporter [Streptomyces sp. t39]
MFSVLRNRTYRHLFVAQAIALLGTGLATVALGLLAHDLAGADAGAVLGTALGIKMTAYVLLAPVVSAVADRVPRRALLAGADLLRAGVALLLPFVGQVWQVYALVFVLQAASATFTPAFQAVVPDVLPGERDYTRALSLSRLAYDLESLLSPALAAALLTVITYNWLFVGTVVGFVASAVLVVSVVLPKPAAAARGRGVRAGAGAGIRLSLAVPRLRALLALDLAVAAASATVTVNTVVLVRDGLGRSTAAVALALGAYGAGSMLVALVLPGALERLSDRTVMLTGGTLLTAVFTGFAPFVTAGAGLRWPALLVAWVLFGAACSMVLTPTGRLLRRSVAPGDRTAVFAAQFSLSHACWLLTYPLAGWLGAAAGLGWALGVLGVVAFLATAAAARLWPRPDGEPAAHLHTDLDAGHPHLSGAVRLPEGWSHSHVPTGDALHSPAH